MDDLRSHPLIRLSEEELKCSLHYPDSSGVLFWISLVIVMQHVRGASLEISDEEKEENRRLCNERINLIYENLFRGNQSIPGERLNKLGRRIGRVVFEKPKLTDPSVLNRLMNEISKQERLLVLAFGYQIAAADGKIDKGERSYLRRVAAPIGLKRDYLEVFEKLFCRQEITKQDTLEEIRYWLKKESQNPIAAQASKNVQAILPPIPTERSYSKLKQEIKDRLCAKKTLIFLHSTEEDRAIKCVVSAHKLLIFGDKNMEHKIYRWSSLSGIEECSDLNSDSCCKDWKPVSLLAKDGKPLDITSSIEHAMRYISHQIKQWSIKGHGQYTYILPDWFHLITKQPNAQFLFRLFKELVELSRQANNARLGISLVVIGVDISIPSLLRHSTCLLHLPLPNTEEICQHLLSREFFREEFNDQDLQDLSKKAVGLSIQAIEDSVQLINIKEPWSDRKVNAKEAYQQMILENKKQEIKKTGILEYYEPIGKGLEAVGGLHKIKQWVKESQKWFEQDSYPKLRPRALLLEGYPGCGKSFISRAISQEWQIPQIDFDISRLQSKWVGESEANVFQALRLIEASSPSILFIDELEKAFSGVGGQSSDVMTRLFGMILSWLNDHNYPIFFIATSNNRSQLPPELFRAGRFDEIFIIMPPNALERREIIQRQIKNYPVAPIQPTNLEYLVDKTFGFSAAELEKLIKSKAYKSASKSIDEQGDWDEVLIQVKPQYKTDKMQHLLQHYRTLIDEGGGLSASDSDEENFLEQLTNQS